VTDLAIQCRGLGKRYRRGERASYRRFSELLTGLATVPWQWATPLGRQSRSRSPSLHDRHDDAWFWALKNIDLDIPSGEVLGIIGRNGAGKSTLLKLLSRITEPTTGEADIFGRVGSLLEVGAGFHPELSGRENIYLYGAVLGMTRAEIRRKFDEIVSFAEVEKFLDLSVKRYSSGMYTRLAFAVAAHLNPEILIVDEVLAVGDADFQKKCLGRMGEVASQGRTVLFVSHNIGAVLSMCRTALLIDAGRIKGLGSASTIAGEYLESTLNSDRSDLRPGFDSARHVIEAVSLMDVALRRTSQIEYGEGFAVMIRTNPAINIRFGVELRIRNLFGHEVAYASSWIRGDGTPSFRSGDNILFRIPSFRFAEDTYLIDVICRIPSVHHIDAWNEASQLQVTTAKPGGTVINLSAADRLGAHILEEATADKADSMVAPL
jgi:lipopolysaccharide transport system ATP-binding protein